MHALGEFVDTETVAAARLRSLGVAVSDEQQFVKRYLLKVGNRDVGGFDFKWFDETEIGEVDYPPTALVAEREEWGNFYGFLIGIKEDGDTVSDVDDLWSELGAPCAACPGLKRHIRDIEKQRIGAVSYRFERLRLETRKLDLGGLRDPQRQQQIELERAQLEQDYAELNQELATLYGEVERDAISAQTVAGDTVDLRVADLVRVFMPNQMGVRQKLVHYLDKLREFVLEDPREANTEGGVFPAIFGTVVMVLLMSVLVTPFGVVAAIYMREYARQGTLTRIIRIAVNNLAGVPSVVYGVFGLGFFVYLVGGSLDELFYPEALTRPNAGYPGDVMVVADAGDPHRAGGHRRHRGGPDARSPEHPRGQPSARRDQGGNAVANRTADGDTGNDDRTDPGRGAGGRRGRAADDGRCGQARAVAAA